MRSTQAPSGFCSRTFTRDPWGMAGVPSAASGTRAVHVPNWLRSHRVRAPVPPVEVAHQLRRPVAQTAQQYNGELYSAVHYSTLYYIILR